ncbi:hypothetical protein [Rhizobium mulingense]|uniref:hypothetical protein n=1 Tax=Rhizobium mulingense TaxID=3031128 RepID=UPI002B48F52F|nr:hypothetical protein [Rhizobium sp. MJ21]MEB3043111.1 hypothetical protein [Rhizobium sp. MJ21]
MLRKRQQGHGRPIITITHNGFRFVAVGQRMTYSRDWRFFPDFLIFNMKDVMGRDWGRDASSLMPDHPVIRWLRKVSEARAAAGGANSIPPTGFISALTRFAYALYLIEHNDSPPKSLLKRLRHPNSFDPASYETIVASAFALAGAQIDGAEDIKGNQPKPEFIATFRGGQRYSVEAKRKRSWKSSFDLDSDAFAGELRSWLRGRVHEASKKQLANPVYWFELGIGEKLSEEDAKRLQSLVGSALEDAETITVKGSPAQPAYIVVTNNPDFANDEVTAITQFALLQGFRMEDFRGGLLDLETAMERHDKHRPIRSVLECLIEVQQVPMSFDGVPDELLDESGAPLAVVKIGDRIAYPRGDGTEGTGRIEEMTALGDEAYVIVADHQDANRVIVKMPLTDAEAKAAKKLGNAIFGKPEGPRENITDILRFYDRMLDTYSDYPRESLLRQIKGHSQAEQFERLSREELVVRIAREVTKSVHYQSSKQEG